MKSSNLIAFLIAIFFLFSNSRSLNTLKTETASNTGNLLTTNTKLETDAANIPVMPNGEIQKKNPVINEKVKKIQEFLKSPANIEKGKDNKERVAKDSSNNSNSKKAPPLRPILPPASTNSTVPIPPVENKFTSTYPNNGEQPFNITVPKDFYASNDDQPQLTQTAKEKLRFFFEPVQYVKDISPAGKATLKRQDLGEFINKLVQSMRLCWRKDLRLQR